jgi:hypothetical protein
VLLKFAKLDATGFFTAAAVGARKEHETGMLTGAKLFGQNSVEVEAQQEEKESTNTHHNEASVKLEIINHHICITSINSEASTLKRRKYSPKLPIGYLRK